MRNWKHFAASARDIPTNEQLLNDADDLYFLVQDINHELQQLCDWKDKKSLVAEKKALEDEIELLRIRAGFQRKPNSCKGTTYDWDYRRRAYNWRGGIERGEVINNGPYKNVTVLALGKSFNMLN